MCVVGIKSERVRIYLSSMPGTLLVKLCDGWRTHTRSWQVCLRDQWIFAPRFSDQRISVFCPKLQTVYCLLKSHADIWISSSPTYFSVYGWLSELRYFRFFPLICWSNLWKEISVTLCIGNKLYSCYYILYFSFLRKPLCCCYLLTALNLLRSSSPAKPVHWFRKLLSDNHVGVTGSNLTEGK